MWLVAMTRYGDESKADSPKILIFHIVNAMFRCMEYKLYLLDKSDQLLYEKIEAVDEAQALALLALAARLSEYEPVGIERLAA